MSQSTMPAINLQEMECTIIQAMQRWEIPGLTIAIVKEGKTVLSKGYGVTAINKTQPVDEHTLFSIAASTVSFTTSALAILVADGKLNWQDRLVDLLPDFKAGNQWVTQHTSVIDVLTNRTGLATEILSFHPHSDISRADILGKIQHLPSASEFRSEWGNSPHMMVAAGEIIPALTGISWDDFVRERLFKPLGMTDSVTGPHLLGANQNIATPHETVDQQLKCIAHTQTRHIGPAMSIYSSAADMAKWLSFQLNKGKVADKVIIPEAQINQMRTSYIGANFEFPGIAKHFIDQGLGVLISDSTSGHKLYSNGGDIDGMESYHAFVPELDLGIAVMTNSTKVFPQPLIAWIIDRYTGAPVKDWVNELVPFCDKASSDMLSNLKKQQSVMTKVNKKPSQTLESYAGIYRHCLLGDLDIQANAEYLSFRLGSYIGELQPAGHDTFYIQVQSPVIGKLLFKGPVQFRLDAVGQIDSLLVVEKEFKRVAADEKS